MKKVFLFILLTSCIISLSAQVKYTEAEKNGLRGPVKTVRIITTATDFRGLLDTLFVERIQEYRKDGQLVMTRNIRKKTDRFPSGHVVSTFDENGLRTQKESFIEDKETGEAKKTGITFFTYDEQKRLKKETQCDSLGSVIQHSDTYSYPNKDTMIQDTYSKSTGTYTITSKLDKWGNEIKRTRKDLLNREYKYDDKGQVVSWVNKEKDGSKFIAEYEYNKEGDQIREATKNYKGNTTNSEHTFEYDEHGSWIKKTKILKNGPYRMSEYRIIEYYND